MNRRVPAALLGLLFIVAACDQATGLLTASPSSPAASPGPGGSQSLLPIPSFPPEFRGAPDLEARLPSTFDGQPLVVLSLKGDTFFENTAPELAPYRGVVDAVGGTGDDVSIAVANAAVALSPFNLVALRIEGADTASLTSAFEQAAVAAQQGGSVDSATLGGRQVTKVTAPGDAGAWYFFGDGDTVFVVQAREDGLAGRLLQAVD